MHGEAGEGDKDGDADSTVAIKVGGSVLTTEDTQAEIMGEVLHW